MDHITLAEAFELFKLPRTLGATAAGEPIIANVGRFGPYVKYGEKYVSLKEDDPYTVTLERALEVIRQKQEADAQRIIAVFGAEGIQVLNGRYGPYVTDGKKNAKIPKDRNPRSLTLEECRELIAQAPERGARFGRGRRRPGAPARPGAGGGAASAEATPARARGRTGRRAAAPDTAAATPDSRAPRAARESARATRSARAPRPTRAGRAPAAAAARTAAHSTKTVSTRAARATRKAPAERLATPQAPPAVPRGKSVRGGRKASARPAARKLAGRRTRSG
jgi:DNA topoisomerase-1